MVFKSAQCAFRHGRLQPKAQYLLMNPGTLVLTATNCLVKTGMQLHLFQIQELFEGVILFQGLTASDGGIQRLLGIAKVL